MSTCAREPGVWESVKHQFLLYDGLQEPVFLRQNIGWLHFSVLRFGCLQGVFLESKNLCIYHIIQRNTALCNKDKSCRYFCRPKTPLCKGSCQPSRLTEGLTTPPSRRSAAHLPLHRGGFGAVQLGKLSLTNRGPVRFFF